MTTLTAKCTLALTQGGPAAEVINRHLSDADLDQLTGAITAEIAQQHSDDAVLVELLAIREQVSRARRYGYTLSLQILRDKAMALAESFVDPDWALEQCEQVTIEAPF